MSHIATISVLCALLVPQLGSLSFRQRERATVALRDLLPLSLPYLEAAENAADLETSIRAGELVQKYYRATAACKADQALPTGYPRLPWLAFPPEHPNRQQLMQYYLSLAQQQIGRKGPPDWEDYRLATQLFIRDLYMNRATAGEVQHWLDIMRDLEIEWIRQNGARYSPPLTLPEGWQ